MDKYKPLAQAKRVLFETRNGASRRDRTCGSYEALRHAEQTLLDSDRGCVSWFAKGT